eukprot:g3866.t1
MVVASQQDSSQEQDEGHLRHQIRKNIEKRRSSFMESFREFLPRKEKMEIKDCIQTPQLIQDLVNKAEAMTMREMTEKISELKMKGMLHNFVRSSTESGDIGVVPTLLLAMRKQMIVKAQKETEKKDVTRVLVAAFFEIADETSDIVMAILFSLDAGNLGWAATLMFLFMGINRAVVAYVAYSFQLPFYQILEGLLGLKSFTDSYRLVSYGAMALTGSVTINTVRSYTLGIGLACESLPQMILQISIVLSELDNDGFNQGLYNVKSDVGTFFTIPVVGIGYFVIVNVSTLLSVRYQAAIGPLPLTYGVVSSMAIAMTSIFLLVNNSLIKVIFGILFGVYVVVWLIFFSAMDETLSSFVFSTIGWKQTIRDEAWNIPMYASDGWGIEELVGDNDANHARIISLYKSSDLPWDKIEKWLIEKKSAFIESPPLWMTVDWFKNLTPEVKERVWTEPGELELLIEKVAEVTKTVNVVAA